MAHTPVSATIPTVVYTPTSSGTPHAFLYNEGVSTVYLGGSGVSTQQGLALAPNDKIRLPYAGGTIWAISGYNTTSPQGTVISATSTFPAGTTLTDAAGTSFTAGMWIAIESGTPRQEIAQVNGSNAGSVFTNSALQYAHGTATTFWQINAVPSLVKSSDVGAT
jgi:hypothetical protein